MRVALVHETVDPRRGGAETSTLEMARELVALGHEITVVYRGNRDHQPDHHEDQIRFHPIFTPSKSRVRRAIGFVRLADEYCREQRFDIVHAISPCNSATVYQPRGGTYGETVRRNLAIERSLVSKAIKWFDRRTNMRQRFLLLLERDLLTDARGPHVAAVSDYVRRQVADDYGVPTPRMRVIFNGVQIAPLDSGVAPKRVANLRDGLGLGKDVPIVLFVAHNFKLKGLRELMVAMAKWPADAERKWRRPALVVVGKDDRAPYVRLRERLRMADDVRFVDSAMDMRSLYAAAEVVAHPTWYDPCSRVVLEALACGVPVVTTRWNGAAEAMQAGVHGEVLDTPADARGLQAAIARCMASEVKARATAAAAAFRQQYNMRRHAEELVEFYGQVLEDRKRRGT